MFSIADQEHKPPVLAQSVARKIGDGNDASMSTRVLSIACGLLGSPRCSHPRSDDIVLHSR